MEWEAGQPYLEKWTKERIGAFLDERPDVMYQILHDVYDAVKTEEEREQGKVRLGRRPRRQVESLDEVLDAITGEPFSMDPFPEAFAGLMNGRSQASFARKVPCHQTTLSRLMNGRLEPDLTMLERIADAAGVHPSYFREWRAMQVGNVVTKLLLEKPNMSVTVLKRVG